MFKMFFTPIVFSRWQRGPPAAKTGRIGRTGWKVRKEVVQKISTAGINNKGRQCQTKSGCVLYWNRSELHICCGLSLQTRIDRRTSLQYYQMGKQLRTRQILDQTDLQNDNTAPTYPVSATLSKNSLRQAISQKIHGKSHKSIVKQSRFSQRVQDGSITALLDQPKFECPICLELMVRPTLMLCGHMYCYRCLETNIAHSLSCSLCRQQQNPEHTIPSPITQNLINQVLAPRSNQVLKYLCRSTDSAEWTKRRQLTNPRPGMILDFQDAFKVWRRAIVLKTFAGKSGNLMLNIKTFFKGTEILETLEASSKRLAPLNFFTRSKYLQEFTPVLPEYDIQLEILQYRSWQSSEELFGFHGHQDQCMLEFQSLERSSAHENLEDQALALFNWEMGESELLF